MASEYDHTDQQDSTDTGSTDTAAPEGGERVDPAPEQSAAPSIDPAAETDAAPAPRTRTRKTAAKTAKAATRKATTPRASRAAKAAAGAPDAADADPATSTSTSASSTTSISGRLSKSASVASSRIADSPPTSYWISANDVCRSPVRRFRTKSSVLGSAGPFVVATLTR